MFIYSMSVNTLRPRQDGRHFADGTFKRIFLKEIVRISIKISLKFVPKSPINNIPSLFQIMAWRRPGDKPLSEAMMASLLTHICVSRDYVHARFLLCALHRKGQSSVNCTPPRNSTNYDKVLLSATYHRMKVLFLIGIQFVLNCSLNYLNTALIASCFLNIILTQGIMGFYGYKSLISKVSYQKGPICHA